MGSLGFQSPLLIPRFVVSHMKVVCCKATKKDIIGESCAEEEGVVLARYVVYES